MRNFRSAVNRRGSPVTTQPLQAKERHLRVLIPMLLTSVLLASCDATVEVVSSSDDISDVFIPELTEENGPLDDGRLPGEPMFHIEGDYEIANSALFTGEPLIGAALPASPERKQQGAWSRVFNWPVSPIHMTLLPDDTVLTYGTNPDAQNATAFTFDKWLRTRGRENDSHETSPTGISTNLFCSAQTILPDGNVLVSGGDGNQVDNQTYKNDGIDATTVFNVKPMSFSMAPQ